MSKPDDGSKIKVAAGDATAVNLSVAHALILRTAAPVIEPLVPTRSVGGWAALKATRTPLTWPEPLVEVVSGSSPGTPRFRLRRGASLCR